MEKRLERGGGRRKRESVREKEREKGGRKNREGEKNGEKERQTWGKELGIEKMKERESYGWRKKETEGRGKENRWKELVLERVGREGGAGGVGRKGTVKYKEREYRMGGAERR